jgi:hypothetical protein
MLDEEVTLHTYLCADEVWRTRCSGHVMLTGPYRPLSRWTGFTARRGTRRECVACVFEFETAVRLSTPLVEEKRTG